MSALVAAISLDTLAERIRTVHEAASAAVRQSVEHAATIGRLLLEAKGLVPHGEWAGWVAGNCTFAERTARAYMQVARRLLNHNDEERQRVADLSLRGTLALIAEGGGRSGTHGTWTGEVEWYTPAEHVEAARELMGGIDLDPASSDHAQGTVRAAAHYTAEQDGLAQSWHGRVWLNPPYDGKLIGAFVEKLLAEHAAGHVPEAVLLVHARTDAQWFHDAARTAAAVCLTRGRIRFEQPDGTGDSPTTGSAFFYFGDRPDRFAATFARLGVVLSTFAAGPMLVELEDVAA